MDRQTSAPLPVWEPFRRAQHDLWTPAGRRVVWRSLALSILSFVVLAVAVQAGIGYFTAEGWLRTLLDVLGGLATLVLVWMLFPAVATFFSGVMLDGFIDVLESEHYPKAAHGASTSWLDVMISGARFALVAIALNLVLLPLYIVLLFAPPLAPLAFLVVNGYLLGREYFELVALRHLDSATARALRKANRGRLLLTGVIIAFLFTIPVLNLFAPLLGAAALVHFFHGSRA